MSPEGQKLFDAIRKTSVTDTTQTVQCSAVQWRIDWSLAQPVLTSSVRMCACACVSPCSTPCVWSGSSFIVLDAVRVSAPYTVASCQTVTPPPPAGANAKRQSPQAAAAEVMLARVRKIVDAERHKLKLTQ